MNEHYPRPTVVCLHGSACATGMWREFTATARGRCDIVTPDSYASDLYAELARLGKPVHLVGHGYGGERALEIAARCPDRVLSLVLYEPTRSARTPVPAVEVPVRLIAGTRSWSAARRSAEHLAERLPSATLLKLVGLRHMAPLTHPRLVSAVMLDYILPVTMPEQDVAA